MPELILVGAGGHGRVLANIIRRDGDACLQGYVDRVDHGLVAGLPYLGDDDVLHGPRADADLLLGLGLLTDARPRRRLLAAFGADAMRWRVLASRRACIAADAVLGAGTVVLDLAAVNPGAVLGPGCLVNTGAVVEHDVRLGANVHVAPHATLCGGVTVGEDCLIGAGATVIPGVAIAAGCVVGAGAVVVADLATPGTYVGSPARHRGGGMQR